MSNPTNTSPAGQAGTVSHAPSRTDQLAGVLTIPVTLAQRLLPASPTPVALGTPHRGGAHRQVSPFRPLVQDEIPR